MSRSASESLEARLCALAEFVDVFTRPGFAFANLVPPREIGPSTFELPYYLTSDAGQQFIRTCYDLGWVIPNFDWSEWKMTSEAAALQTPRTIAKATPEQLAKLLTMFIRQERFSEGTLDTAFKDGLLTAIVERARDFTTAQKGPFEVAPQKRSRESKAAKPR